MDSRIKAIIYELEQMDSNLRNMKIIETYIRIAICLEQARELKKEIEKSEIPKS